MQSQIIVDRFLRSSLSHSFNLNVYERILLVMLASYAGKKDNCYPSHLALSLNCSISVDSVRRNLQKLAEKKLIRIKHTMGSSNVYTLIIPIEAPMANSTNCSQQPPADSDTPIPLTAIPPPADSDTNNISNNATEYTLLKNTNASPKRSRFPESMVIGETHKKIASELSLNVIEEFQHFKEHHLSKGSKFERWDLAFNLWLRNASKFQKKPISLSTRDPMAGVIYE